MFYKDFTVSFFLKMIRKRIKFIVLLTLVGGILTLLYANFFITPSYSAQAMVIVQNYTAADAAADAAEEAAQTRVCRWTGRGICNDCHYQLVTLFLEYQ